ncbi:Hypothetical protein Minf_1605 [Methylacidiphilum infernorum V4]|uniref:Uncharacterized protein n=1 Tax=Methylacidiphilum infernorum (isolate V4) TaxID=481448 RepID=B3DWF6_METI4|nr:Hypothetical protein Minf_1605 [Methylacidiphilum infernorum V4]
MHPSFCTPSSRKEMNNPEKKFMHREKNTLIFFPFPSPAILPPKRMILEDMFLLSFKINPICYHCRDPKRFYPN